MHFEFIRNKRLRAIVYPAVGFSFLFVLYAAAGLWIVPYCLKARLPEIAAARLQGSLRLTEVRFNPFSGRLEFDQMALATLDGQSALTAEHVFFDIAVAASLRSGYLVVEGMADQVGLRICLDTKGVSNWTKLMGGTGESPAPRVPFGVERFSIRNAGVEFIDEGSKVHLGASEVNADLYGLGPDLSEPARLEMKASIAGRAKVSGNSELTLIPFHVNPVVYLDDFDLTSIAAYLEGMGVVIKQGRMKGNLAFEYGSDEAGQVFRLGKSNLIWHDVQWGMKNGPDADWEVDDIRLDGLEYDGATATLRLAKSHIDTLAVASRNGVKVRICDADLGKLLLDLYRFSAQAGSIAIRTVDLTQDRGSGSMAAAVSNLWSNGLGWSETRLAARGLGWEGMRLWDSSATLGEPPEIRFRKMSAEDVAADFVKRSFSMAKFDSADAEISAWISPKREFEIPGFLGDWAGVIRPGSSNEGWAFSLGEGVIRNYRLNLADHGVDPPARIGLDDLEIRLQGVDTRQGKFALRLESVVDRKGRISVQGSGSFDPPEAELRLQVENLGLRPFRSYLDDFARIDLAKGRLNLEGGLAYRPVGNDVRFSGTAEIAGLVTVDRKDGRDFIHWRSLRAEGLTLETSANRLSIRQLVADRPYARIVVSRQRTLNLIENLFQPRSKPAGPSGQASRPFAVTVGSLLVRDGSADFSDLSLQPSVSVDIRGLTGVVQSLSSRPDAEAEVSIKGSISDTSPVTISGRINPFLFGTFADLSIRFKNVDLTELSPYSARFAGYRIDKGKADLDLHYRLRDRKLLADNNLVFDHLTLGERVDSPEAISLPVKLAVSLMRGLDGKINIDLPISGNLDDPKFSITGLLTKAAVGVITKVVSSPFSAIGMLFDGGSDDAGSIDFRPGSFELEGAEKSRLDGLATALSQRPGLSLEIRGTARSGRDASALAEQQLRRQLENAKAIELRLAGGDRDRAPAGSSVLSGEDYRRLFSHFYRLRYPGAAEWAALPRGERVLGGELFESARGKVLKDWSISEIDLRRLAQARAAAVRSYLVQKGIEPTRIYLLDVELTPGDGDTVALLSLS